MNRKLSMFLMVGVLVVLFSGAALAAPTWYECKVLAVGGSVGGSLIQLGHPVTGANYGWYLISGDMAKEMLATALTAVSLNKTVWCILDMNVTSSLQAVYLKGY